MFRSLRNMVRSLTRITRKARRALARPHPRMMAYRKFGLQLEHLEAREVPAAILFNNVATYTQDFQSISDTNDPGVAGNVSGTTMTEVSGLAGGGTVSGWYAYPTTAAGRWGRSDGGSNTGSFYGMRDTGAGVNLALGSQGSGSMQGFFGLVLQNTSGSTISSVTFSYDAVINRNPATTVNAYPMSYRVSATNIVSGASTADGTFHNSAGTWSTGTGFSTPSSGTGGPGAQAAINPIFQIGGTTITQTISSLTWGASEFLYIRFGETDEGSSDATAGVDNVTIAPAGLSAPTITTPSPLTTAYETQAYTTTIAASGSPAPTFAVTAGTLPAGLTLSSAGVLSGTPTATGSFNFSVTATNSQGADTDAFTMSVIAGTTTTLTAPTPNPANFQQAVTFSGTVTASSGGPVNAGTVQIKASAGGTVLGSGTVDTNGNYSFTISTLNPGSYATLAAYYVGTSTFGPSNSANIATPLVVNPFTTSGTTLAAGDIAFTGYYGDTTTGDGERFSFVLLKDVAAGTSVIFTDAGYDGNALVVEGTYAVVFDTARTAGSRFYYETTPAATTGFKNFDGTQTGLTTYVYGNTGFSNGGDNLFAIQGSVTSPTFLAGFSALNYITTGMPTSSNTYVPSALANGQTMLSLGGDFNGNLNPADPDVGATVSGSVGAIDLIVNTVGNWTTTTGSNPSVVPPAVAFIVTTGGTATTTLLNAPSPGTVTQGFPVTFTGTVMAASGVLTPTGTIQIREGGPTGTLLATTSTFTGTGATANYSFSSSTVPAGTFTNVTAYFIAGSGFANSNSAGGQSLTVNAASPTTYAAGDVAFTGYLGLPTNERFSFVVLKDTNATTSLTFTDNAFDGAAFATGEGLYSVTFNQFYAAGSRFYYQSNGGSFGAFYNFDGTTTGLTTTTGGTGGTNPGFSNSGDNLTAIQGTLAAPTSFVAAIATKPFLTTGTTTPNDTYLPTGLAVGTNAITLNQGGTAGIDGSLTTPPNTVTAGTAAGIATTVNSLTNWNISPQTITAPPLAVFTITSGIGTTTGLTATPSNPAPSTTFDLVATVSPNPGAGINVVFRSLVDNGTARSFTTLGTAQTDANGVATLTVTGGLAGGNYTLTADFAGDASFGASLGVLNLASGTATTTAITGSVAPGTAVAVGGTTTYTATVNSGGNPVTTGNVQFFDNGVAIGGLVAVNGSGQATTPATALAQGPHFITAQYLGGGAFTGSTTPAAYTQNVLNQFGANNVVVVRMGTGTGGLSSGATYVFIDEINSAGTLVQSLVMPGLDSGSNQQFFDSGSATSDGGLNLSVSGQYITLTGYDAPAGTTGVVAAAGFDRVVARIDALGNIDTTTTIDQTEFFAGNNIRSAVTDDGTRFWAAGSNTNAGTGGVAYTQLGASTGAINIQPAGVFSPRVVSIYGGNLFISSTFSNNIHQIGTGLPITTGQTATVVPGLSDTVFTNPYGYVFLDRDAGVAGVDTLYIADQNTAAQTPTGGIYKYSFNGTTWTSQGVVLGDALYTGLVGSIVGGNVTLYATQGGTSTTGPSSASKVITLTDTALFNAAISGTPTNVFAMPADSNKAFRGISFVPYKVGTTATTTALTPASSSITEGQPASLTATVSTTSANGLVSLQQGGVTIASAQAVNGVATFNLTGLLASGSPYSYTAVYNGDVVNAASPASAAATVTVTAGNATTTMIASGNNGVAPVATNIVMSVTVVPTTGALTSANGTVALTLNGAPLNVTPTYGTSGNNLTASFSVPVSLLQTFTGGTQVNNLTPGITSVTAVYTPASGDPSLASNATLNQQVQAAAFGAGNLTVFRSGNGVQSNLVTTGSAVFVDEVTPAGVLVQSIAFPTITVGASHSLLADGQQSTDNQLTRSGDGTKLYVAGYESPTGFLASGNVRAVANRTIGQIGIGATPTVSSAVSVSGINPGAANLNLRGVYSPDGDKVYLGGSGGLFYVPSYATASGAATTAVTTIDSTVNVYAIGQLGSDLLITQNIATPSIGTYTGLPVASATFSALTGFPTTQTWTAASATGDPSRLIQPFFADLVTGVGFGGTLLDTLYVGSSQIFDASPLSKYTWTGSAWTLAGNIVGVAATPGFNYLVGSQTGAGTGSSVTLYVTHDRGGSSTSDPQSTIYSVVDTNPSASGFSNTTPTVVKQNTAATNPNQYYRGISSILGAAAPAPTVTLLSPTSGPTAGGTVVTITGTNFTAASTVVFGANAAASVTFNSATSLTATAPAGAAGTVNVQVTTAGGQSANNGTLDDFTYVAATNGVLQFSSGTFTTSEGVGTFSAVVTRTGGSTGIVGVTFTVTPGSATAGATNDYVTITSSPLSFAAGATSQLISFTVVDDGSNEVNQDFSIALSLPTGGATLGTSNTSTTVTITDPILVVSSLTGTNSGVIVNFNRAFDQTQLNLYDAAGGTLGAADVTVTGTTGSLVVLPGNQLYFAKTGGELAASTFTTTIRSAANGLKDVAGVLLDGDANGTAGGDYSNTFTVASYTGTKVVRVGDFARGRTQAVTIPLTINDASGVTAVDAELIYDPTLLDFGTGTITSPVAGWSGSFNPNFATLPNGLRVAKFNVFGSSALTGTNLLFANIPATVPATALYANKEVLRLQNTFWNESNVIRTDDAVHVAAYFGDATGNGGLSGQDASLVSQLAAGSGSGFVAYQNADPVLIADATLNGGLSGQDASLISQKAAGAAIASIPDPGPANPAQGGPDPRMYFGNFTASQGQTVTVPMRFNVAEIGGITGVQSMDMAGTFDANRFTVSNVRYKPGSPWAAAGWVVTANVDNSTGTLRIITFATTSQTALAFVQDYDDESLLFDFFVKPTAPVGTSPLDVAQNVGLTNTAINEGAFTLLPAPTNATNQAGVDGTFTVTAATTTANLFWAGANAAAGGTFTTQLRVSNNGSSNWTATSIDTASTFDPTKLQIVSVTAGSLLTGAPTAWTVTANIDNTNGTLRVITFASNTPGITVIPGQIGDVLNVTFQVAPTASGTTFIDLRPIVNPTTTAINEGAVALSPLPANATNQGGVDAVITITVNPNKPPFNAVPAATQRVLWNSAQQVATPNTVVFSGATSNAIVVTDGNGVVNVTTTLSVGTSGILTLGSTTGVTVSGNSTGTVTVAGTTTDVTAALDGLTYRPNAGFNGDVLLTVTTSDGGNSGFGGPLTDTRTIVVQVVGLFISEVFFNDGTNSTVAGNLNEYIEVFSTVPNYTIPSDVYFIGIEGDAGTGANNPGSVQDIFRLGGFVTGANGYLALLQKAQQYGAANVLVPAGTTVANASTGATGNNNNAGFGNGAATSRYSVDNSGTTFITNVHSGQSAAAPTGIRPDATGEFNTDIENGSVSYLLVQAATAPVIGNDIDSNNDGATDGAVFAGWNVFDSVAALDGGTTDRGYAAITFRQNGTGTGTGNVVTTTFTPGYVGRVLNFKGSSSADWLASSTPTGSAGAFALGTTTNAAFNGQSLNHVGGVNAWAPRASVVVNDGSSGQRSQVSQLLVGFTAPAFLDLNATAFAVYTSAGTAISINVAPQDGIDNMDGTFSGVTQVKITFNVGVGTFAFTAADPLGNTVGLTDGNFFLKVFSSQVSVNGVNLDGDGDGFGGGNQIEQFHRLFGDTNGDRTVDGVDNAVFNTTRNKTSADVEYLWFLDADLDGDVFNDDRTQFRNRLWSYLPPSNTPPSITP